MAVQRIAAAMPAAVSGRDHVWCGGGGGGGCAAETQRVVRCRYLEHVQYLRLWPSVAAMLLVSSTCAAGDWLITMQFLVILMTPFGLLIAFDPNPFGFQARPDASAVVWRLKSTQSSCTTFGVLVFHG